MPINNDLSRLLGAVYELKRDFCSYFAEMSLPKQYRIMHMLKNRFQVYYMYLTGENVHIETNEQFIQFIAGEIDLLNKDIKELVNLKDMNSVKRKFNTPHFSDNMRSELSEFLLESDALSYKVIGDQKEFRRVVMEDLRNLFFDLERVEADLESDFGNPPKWSIDNI